MADSMLSSIGLGSIMLAVFRLTDSCLTTAAFATRPSRMWRRSVRLRGGVRPLLKVTQETKLRTKRKSRQREVARDCFNIGRFLTTERELSGFQVGMKAFLNLASRN
jgi:hypothetical protein